MVLITAAMQQELAAFDNVIIPFAQIMKRDDGSLPGRVRNDLERLSMDETGSKRTYAAAVIGTGKILSALSIQRLIDTKLFHTVVHVGICGGCSSDMPPGSLVFPEWTMQHDIDLRNFGFPRGQIPYTSLRKVLLTESLQKRLMDSARHLVDIEIQRNSPRRTACDDYAPFFRGGLLSGDEFVTASRKQELLEEFSEIDVSCVDMEGFSAASAAFLQGIPCGMVRAVSDDLSGRRPKNFKAFLNRQSHLFRLLIEDFCSQPSA